MAEQDNHQQPQPQPPRSQSENEAAAGIFPSHGISINLPEAGRSSRPHPVKHMSAPTYQSPIRHHRRAPSKSKDVKETLNARSHYGSGDDDGAAVHRINQYIIKQEIGRGSFGAVHLATDQYGNEFAVKEFSKSRLRKRAQSNLLRKPNQQRRPGHLAAGLGFNSPLHRFSSSDKVQQTGDNNSLSLIKEEIAIMKKLNHNNLVNLIEVLDDPQEDSLYMVLEMCKKGVVMKVGLEERAEPYEQEACRCWFRDLILGIEYLHEQGIIHRDIKPDNCLITDDDVLKIVDFGVSEMFEKQSDMAVAKSAGSPAFMPPELCVARHGPVSGRAADIWSMGITLYCLRYGHIPFEKTGMLELYESIRDDDLPLNEERDQNFADLMRRILEKDPEKRITLEGLRQHPWVTKGGSDPLLSAEENCADLVAPPTEAEMDNAITGNMVNLLAVMKAVKRFKKLLQRKRPQLMQGIFGRESRLVTPPHAIRGGSGSKSIDAHDRMPINRVLVTEGVHSDVVDDEAHKLPPELDKMLMRSPSTTDVDDSPSRKGDETEGHHNQRMESESHHPRASDPDTHHTTNNDRSYTFPVDDHAKGHAHDPLTDTLFLGLGAANNPHDGDEGDPMYPIVSETPPVVEMNIYEQAYQDEMKRILDHRGEDASMYLNRRVEHRDDLRSHDNILDSAGEAASGAASKLKGAFGKGGSGGAGGLAALVRQAKEKDQGAKQGSSSEEAPLQASKIDGAQDGSTSDNDALLAAQATMQARIDADQAIEHGMPGGFPDTPGLEGSPS